LWFYICENYAKLRICFWMRISFSDEVFFFLLRCFVLEICSWVLIVERSGEYAARDNHISLSGEGDLEKYLQVVDFDCVFMMWGPKNMLWMDCYGIIGG
jgi:hypothetical protein